MKDCVGEHLTDLLASHFFVTVSLLSELSTQKLADYVSSVINNFILL